MTPPAETDILKEMVESIGEAEEIVRKEILRCVPETEFISLFGSFARNQVRPFSDIDVALCAQTEPEILTLGDAAGAIQDATGRPVDILLVHGLADRDPELAFKVASEGVLIYERHRHSYAFFKKEAFLYYLDTAYLRALNKKALHQRVRSLSMGKRNYV